MEGIVSSVIPPDGKLLVVSNGAYGVRMGAMASVHGINHTVMTHSEDKIPCPTAVAEAVRFGGYTHVGVVSQISKVGIFLPPEYSTQ